MRLTRTLGALAIVLAPALCFAQGQFPTVDANGAIVSNGPLAVVAMCVTTAGSDVGPGVGVPCGTHGTTAATAGTGPPGATGATGATGAAGTNGTNGTNGAPGAAGPANLNAATPASAPPTTGTYAIGTFVQNTAPTIQGTSPGRYLLFGWICTTAGTPGTWTPVAMSLVGG